MKIDTTLTDFCKQKCPHVYKLDGHWLVSNNCPVEQNLSGKTIDVLRDNCPFYLEMMLENNRENDEA